MTSQIEWVSRELPVSGEGQADAARGISENAIGNAHVDLAVNQLIGYNRLERIITVDPSDLNILSSVAETSLFDYPIGGGTITSQGCVNLKIWGTYLNNSGATSTIRLRVYYGATTMYDDTTAAQASNANQRIFNLDLNLFTSGSTQAQGMVGEVLLSAAAGPTTGVGSIAAPALGQAYPIAGSASEDSTLNKNFKVTFTHSNNSANTAYARLYVVLSKTGH